MSRLSPVRLVALLALTTTALQGCARSESSEAVASEAPAATPASTISSGDVAVGSGAQGLSDSISTRADRGRIKGSPTATVWLVEVSDFQCPYCKQWHDQTFATIEQEYVRTGKVRLAYLNYPIDRIHPHARAAAETAMCASVQGKFWELHDGLFDTQAQWAASKAPMAIFDSLARAGGVDHPTWQTCMKSHATMKLIDADVDRTTRAGVGSTPTFFVGDRAILGAMPVDSFRVALDQAIAKAKGTR